MPDEPSPSVKLDELGPWSRCKHAILHDYMVEYAKILATQPYLKLAYIDAFCGAGVAIEKATGDLVAGSPLLALDIRPKFQQYHFIDTDGQKTAELQRQVGNNPDVTVHPGDCNEVLLELLPKLTYEGYWRAVCFLDPYALHLNWKAIEMAGRMKTIEIFLNFPIADMNRNVLRRDQSKTRPDQAARMTAFWGDESWRDAAFSNEGMLAGFTDKTSNEQLAEAFRERLQKVAGFKCVPPPAAMKNSTGATVYYLFFASQKEAGNKIASHLLREWPKKWNLSAHGQ